MLKFILIVLVMLILICVGALYYSNRNYGKHNGAYQPSVHWSHPKCYPNGLCLLGIRSVMIRPYIDVGSKVPWNEVGTIPNSQSIRFQGEAINGVDTPVSLDNTGHVTKWDGSAPIVGFVR